MDIPFSVNEIIQTPMEEFNDLLTRSVRLRLPQALIMITTTPTVTNNDEHHEKSTFDRGEREFPFPSIPKNESL